MALGLSRLVAVGMPGVPTINPGESLPASEPPRVVFAPPTAPVSRIQFTIAPIVSEGPAFVYSLPATSRASAVETIPAPATVESAQAVAFPTPRYEAPVYKLSRLERETLAACLVLEAASQGEFGMRAVMAVIRNRAGGEPELFAPTVLQPKQFSALNKVTAGYETLAAAIRRARRDRVWATAVAIVDDAIHGQWHDPTGGATHYTRSAERTRWTRSLAKTTTIGAHSFYR